jgi:hypothetical protein
MARMAAVIKIKGKPNSGSRLFLPQNYGHIVVDNKATFDHRH